ncbi:MAG TPA: ABC transporter substrate-binding protein [bacterium]
MTLTRWSALTGAMLATLLCLPFAASAQSIKIAIAGPMKAAPGQDAWNGATLAAEAINAAGGVKVGAAARQIQLVQVDTNEIRSITDSAKLVDLAITQGKVDFLVGGYRDESVLAMQDAVIARKKLFLGVGAQTAELGTRVERQYNKYKYWFRVAPLKSGDGMQALFSAFGAAANQLRTEFKSKSLKVGILGERTVYVDSLVKAAQETLPKMGLDVAGTWRPALTATGLTEDLNAVKRSGAQLVMVFLSGAQGATLGRQWNELQINAIPFGPITTAQQDGYWEATAKKGNGVATLVPYGDAALTPATRDFVKAYRERFKATPGPSAAAYDAVMVLRAAIEQAATVNADALVAALEKTDMPATFGRLVFDKRHDPTFGPGYITGIAVQWQDGAAVPIWPNGWRDVTVDGVKPLRLPPGMKK